jgi:hypothetical protein
MMPIAKPDKRWLTPKMRTWLWGFGLGALTMWLGVSIGLGKLSTVTDRIDRVVQAVQEPQGEVQP